MQTILQKENQYSKGIKTTSTYVWPKAKGKYLAFCEGDDYWTDPYKLQKQFDFMEKHKSCSMCFHRAQVVVFNKKKYGLTKKFKKDTVFYKGSFFHSGGMKSPTASLFIRTRFLKNLPKWYINYGGADVSLKLILAQQGDICYLNEIMAVHRLGVKGSWNSRMRGNASERVEHHKKAINLLDKFNEYTSYKHSREIVEKKFFHEIRLLPFRNRGERIALLRKKEYSEYVKNLPLYKRLLLKIFCFFPIMVKLHYYIKSVRKSHY